MSSAAINRDVIILVMGFRRGNANIRCRSIIRPGAKPVCTGLEPRMRVLPVVERAVRPRVQPSGLALAGRCS